MSSTYSTAYTLRTDAERSNKRKVASAFLALLFAFALLFFVFGRGPGSLTWLSGGQPPSWLPFAGSAPNWLPFISAHGENNAPSSAPTPTPVLPIAAPTASPEPTPSPTATPEPEPTAT